MMRLTVLTALLLALVGCASKVSEPAPQADAADPGDPVDPKGKEPPDEEPHYHPEPLWAVVLRAEDEPLPVYEAPGQDAAVVGTLLPAMSDLTGTGREETIEGTRWVEILLPEASGSGWVDGHYLTEYVAPHRFCAPSDTKAAGADPTEELLHDLAQALRQRDSSRLANLASPERGLHVRVQPYGETRVYEAEEIREGAAFHGRPVSWGPHPYTGEPIRGSFAEEVADDLVAVVDAPSTTQQCNQVVTGGAAYDVRFPMEYVNFNLIGLHFPGSDVHDGLDWVTWVVAVDYVDGLPHVVGLSRYAR